MKTQLTAIALFLLVVISSFAQNSFLYRNGKKRQLLTSDNQIALKIDQPIEVTRLKSIVSFHSIQNISQEYVILTLNEQVNESYFTRNLKKILTLENVKYVSPVFVDQSGKPLGLLSERLIIKLRKNVNIQDIQKDIDMRKSNILKRDDFDERIY